jgi:hypothetical protein
VKFVESDTPSNVRLAVGIMSNVLSWNESHGEVLPKARVEEMKDFMHRFSFPNQKGEAA